MILLALLAALLLPFVLIGGPVAFFWKQRRRAILRGLIVTYPIVVVAVVFGFGPYWLARMLTRLGTRPPDMRLMETPADYHLKFQNIAFDAADGIPLGGWFIAPESRNAVVVGTHGLFRNRHELLERIVPLCDAGYGALLYDSRSHGASGKATVSLGYYEKNDVMGAVHWLDVRYSGAANPPAVVLLGVSMGAVAVLEAAAASDHYSALILDSPFSSLRRTVADHTRLLLRLPSFPFANLFLFWFRRTAHFDPDTLDSHLALRHVRPVPLLIIASEGDRRIPAAVARSLYEESTSGYKRLKIFGPEVPHGAAARLHPQEYSGILKEFLEGALAEPRP
jgi:pimeloyl-ACP methyl ester carboxylesterase